jgi:tetratricopeptide (TPR) repeat protein/transcriptional regulator with XRE-family HTH domain
MSEPVPLRPRSSPLRPNWRLKAARDHCGWSQQELANLLNTTPNSVSRWERGISSPGPHLRRQLCELLGKSAEELGLLSGKPAVSSPHASQLQHVSHSPVLPIWNVPFQHNSFFTGREQELMHLYQRLHGGKSRAARAVQALCGLAGMGKTQTAVEYSYRFYEEYQAVLWVRADTREMLIADFVALASLLDLPERDERDQQHVVKAVKGWLKEHRDWLLILDNIEDLALIQEFVPPIHQGHILLTMRVQATGTLAQSLTLRKMEAQEGALFLLRRAKYLPPEAQASEAEPAAYANALKIAQLLDGLPLALDQAGAYIEETACSFADYIERYQSQRATLLTLRGSAVTSHPSSVATMLSLIIERVEALHPAAADLLRLCAFLQPDAIPEAMIIEGASAPGSILQPLASNPYAFDAAIKTLRDFSLIQRYAENKTLSLHRLVQVVIQDRLDEQARRQWAEWTVALVSHAFPDSEDDTNWSRCQRYLPQALECATLIERWEIVSHEVGVFLHKLGLCLLQRSQYAQAESLLQQARGMLLSTVGEMHPDLARCLNDLGLNYMYQGNYAQAEALYQQSLSIREQVCSTDFPALLENLNNMAALKYKLGKYAQAEALFRRALEIKESFPEPENLDMTYYLSNLAFLCIERGKYAQAEPLVLREVALRERLLGPEHPSMLNDRHSMADLYAALKQYEQAEALHLQILARREKLLGAEHVHVGISLHSLAHLYHDMGQYEQAEAFYQRALTLRERIQGPEHPFTAQTLNGLAQILLERGQDEQAEELGQRARAIQERVLGPEHPDYADSLVTLALLAEKRGDENRALQLYQQALDICEGELMSEHPLVMRCRAAYNRLLAREQGQQPAATDLLPTMPVQESASEPEERTYLASTGEVALLDDFLAACCELHPRAWCRAADLWSAYQRWAEQQGERFPLSRRAFTNALKQQGCRPARTNEYRIWRGIALHARLPEP